MSMIVVGKEREESHVCHSYKTGKRATCVTHTMCTCLKGTVKPSEFLREYDEPFLRL